MQQDKDNQIVEDKGVNNRLAPGTALLLIASLLLCLPIYLLILYLLGDPVFTIRHSPAGHAGKSQSVPVVKKINDMNFATTEQTTINSQTELAKAMICTFELKSGAIPKRVYLRLGTFDGFSATGMESFSSRTADNSWPDFAFSGTPRRFSNFTEATANLHFFCNFEERLPHVAPLQKLAGPLSFCAMHDGSIVLEQTIAVGDEFEIGYLDVPKLGVSDKIAKIVNDSPYLSVNMPGSDILAQLADKIVGDARPGVPTVLKIVEFLESNGEYRSDYQKTIDMHPVKEFLLNSMTGHCQHFAAALVLLCRLRGIPTRVAGGLSSDQRRDNHFIFVDSMAHAWTEVLTEDGWKCIDISPQRSNSPQAIAPSLPLPTATELEDMKNHLKKENARHYAAGGKGSDSEVDAAELSEIVEEPPRNRQQKTQSQSFEKAQAPGTVVKDSARTEEQLRKAAERERIKQKKERSLLMRDIVKKVVPLILLATIIWLITQNAEKWLKWLFKFRKKNSSGEKNSDKYEEELGESIAEMINMSGFELRDEDVVDLFNRFTDFMKTRGFIARSQHETPGEYFDRICLEFNFRAGDGKAAARCFEARLYGGQTVAAADVQKFLHFLQQILGRLKQC